MRSQCRLLQFSQIWSRCGPMRLCHTMGDRLGFEKCATGSASSEQEHKMNGWHRIKFGQWNIWGLNFFGKLFILGIAQTVVCWKLNSSGHFTRWRCSFQAERSLNNTSCHIGSQKCISTSDVLQPSELHVQETWLCSYVMHQQLTSQMKISNYSVEKWIKYLHSPRAEYTLGCRWMQELEKMQSSQGNSYEKWWGSDISRFLCCLQAGHKFITSTLFHLHTVTLYTVGTGIRGVRVYPYPRVYPYWPVPAGMGRVRVDVLRVGSGTGTKSTGRVYPFLPVKNTIFHDVGARMFFFHFFLLNKLLTIKVETLLQSDYNRIVTYLVSYQVNHLTDLRFASSAYENEKHCIVHTCTSLGT